MNKHLVSMALLAGLAGAGCQHAAAPVQQTPQPLLINTFAQKWTTATDRKNGPVRSLFVREDILIAYTNNATAYVVSRDTGLLEAELTIPGGLERLHAPVVNKDSLVFPTLNSLEIFDRKTGRPLRTQLLPFSVRSDGVGSKNLVFIGGDYPGGGRGVALDLTRVYAPIKWPVMFPGSAIVAAPAYANDTVFIAAEDGSVAAVASDSSDPVWSLPHGIFKADGSIVADLKVDDAGLFVATTEGRLYCLNRITGKIKWQYFTDSSLQTPPMVTKTLVYQFVPGTGLVALDKLTGKFGREPRWIDKDAIQFLAEDDKFAYVRRNDNHLIALDKLTGKQLFSSKRNDFVSFGSNLKDAVIYAATQSGDLVGIIPVLKPGTVGEVVRGTSIEWEQVATAR